MIGKTKFKSHKSTFDGIYRGTVLDNDDPSKYGRIKVKIYPMMADIAAADLPWAIPAASLVEGAGTNKGSFTVPNVGTNVWCFFEMGDIYQPVFFAEAPDALKGLPIDRLINYPNRKVTRHTCGITHILDDTLRQDIIQTDTGMLVVLDAIFNTITITHPSGMTFIIGGNGGVSIGSPGDLGFSAPNVKIEGNVDISTGWSGTFTTGDGRTVTVSGGIITQVN